MESIERGHLRQPEWAEVERKIHLHSHDGRADYTSGARLQDDHDRRELSQGAQHAIEPIGKKRGSGAPDRPHERRHDIKLHAVSDANSRPISFCMTAGQVSDYNGAAALLDSAQSAVDARRPRL